ncbi:GFA family protein [Phenylobacterium sp.]|uniref:GFA family protein n=1 Tax=Phenylobacterium sp. TaxID=1871053 RepID=UPI00271DE177|nr:GFA family protein [Phenylobacterium sp.]MDO8802029.1 GFA family protein [Phenylobacterium sp.]
MSGWSGGCQCGAVRFHAESLGRPSICHCRMCQKAFGGFYGPYVDAEGFAWTRGQPKYFQSSNLIKRGFCGDCGTQLSFESPKWAVNVAIGAFDQPEKIVPTLQIGLDTKLPYLDSLADLPDRAPEQKARMAAFYASLVSHQHPDHDTEVWPPNT